MKKKSYLQLIKEIFIIFSLLNLTFEEIEKNNKIQKKQQINHESFLKTLANEVIETERLYLSFSKYEDLEYLAPFLLDEEAIGKFDSFTVWPKTIEEAKEYLSKQLSEENEKNYFTIKIKETNEPIGQIGFSFMQKGTLWICYWLSNQHQKKGYMSEVSMPLIKIVFETCNDLEILHIRALATNTSSIKLAKKICAFVNKENKYKYHEYKDNIIALSREEKKIKKYPVIQFKLFKEQL